MPTSGAAPGGDLAAGDTFLTALSLIATSPCLAEPGKLVVVGQPSRSLSEVLPYVNAILPNVLAYHPPAGTMTLRRRPGFITFYPDKVYITQVNDAAEGLTMLEAVRDLLNQIWARRQSIAPVALMRRRPGMLDVWKLLPRSNCKRCGLPTCMAFAVGLLLATATLAACAPLAEPKAAGQRSALIALLNLEAPSS